MPFFRSFSQIWKDLLAVNNLFFSYLHINGQIVFFPHSIEQTIFFCQFGEQIIFLRKNHTPPPPLVLNGPPLNPSGHKFKTLTKKKGVRKVLKMTKRVAGISVLTVK